jgi:hypothetical protein
LVQALQGLVDPLLPVPAVQCFDLALHRVEVAVAQAILFDQADHPLQAGADSDKNSRIRIELRFLRYIRDAGTALHLQGAVVGFLHTRQNFEHGGFARAVAANQAHTFGGFQ